MSILRFIFLVCLVVMLGVIRLNILVFILIEFGLVFFFLCFGDWLGRKIENCERGLFMDSCLGFLENGW